MKATFVLKGGKGSGNFDHAGIPGHQGGSTSSGSGVGIRSSIQNWYRADTGRIVITPPKGWKYTNKGDYESIRHDAHGRGDLGTESHGIYTKDGKWFVATGSSSRGASVRFQKGHKEVATFEDAIAEVKRHISVLVENGYLPKTYLTQAEGW